MDDDVHNARIPSPSQKSHGHYIVCSPDWGFGNSFLHCYVHTGGCVVGTAHSARIHSDPRLPGWRLWRGRPTNYGLLVRPASDTPICRISWDTKASRSSTLHGWMPNATPSSISRIMTLYHLTKIDHNYNTVKTLANYSLYHLRICLQNNQGSSNWKLLPITCGQQE